MIERKRVASAVGVALFLALGESIPVTRTGATCSVTSFVDGDARVRVAISTGQNFVYRRYRGWQARVIMIRVRYKAFLAKTFKATTSGVSAICAVKLAAV